MHATTEPTDSVPRAQGVTPAGDGGAWQWLRELAAEPALLEVLVLAVVAAVVFLVGTHLVRRVREARARGALSDYLLGVEQALAGDVRGAAKRLRKVLAEDPENAYARLLYGEVLCELGEPGAAHKEHLLLQRSFGIDSRRNELGLARSLLDSGRAGEAVEVAAHAVQRVEDRAGLRLLFAAQLAAGQPEEAGRTGCRLAPMLSDGGERRAVRARAAAALALAGAVRSRGGDDAGAAALCREAESLEADVPELRQLRARQHIERGDLPAATALAVPALAEGATGALAVEAGRAAVLPAPYVCPTCRGALPRWQLRCPHCEAGVVPELAEPALSAPIEDAAQCMDGIDANRAHVRRQVRAALAGDGEAVEDLAALGGDAVAELLAAAARPSEPPDVLVGVLRGMGPPVIPALFAALRQATRRPLGRISGLLQPSREAAVVGRVVQGFGRDALPFFEELVDTEDRELRKVVLDFLIGLADETELAAALARFAPVEVIHRLNAAPRPVLVALLRTVRGDGFVASGLLVQSSFRREAELVEALAGAREPAALIGVLERRGYTPQLGELLVDALGDAALAPVAGDALDRFATRALDQMLSAYADQDRSADVREGLATRIAALGPDVVAPVCALFGPSASALDDDLHRLLVAVGPVARGPLAEAYRSSGLVERLAGRLPGRRTSRHSHRRVRIIRALCALRGGEELRSLRADETDDNLALRLAQALHEIEGGAGGIEPPAAERANDLAGDEHGAPG